MKAQSHQQKLLEAGTIGLSFTSSLTSLQSSINLARKAIEQRDNIISVLQEKAKASDKTISDLQTKNDNLTTYLKLLNTTLEFLLSADIPVNSNKYSALNRNFQVDCVQCNNQKLVLWKLLPAHAVPEHSSTQSQSQLARQIKRMVGKGKPSFGSVADSAENVAGAESELRKRQRTEDTTSGSGLAKATTITTTHTSMAISQPTSATLPVAKPASAAPSVQLHAAPGSTGSTTSATSSQPSGPSIAPAVNPALTAWPTSSNTTNATTSFTTSNAAVNATATAQLPPTVTSKRALPLEQVSAECAPPPKKSIYTAHPSNKSAASGTATNSTTATGVNNKAPAGPLSRMDTAVAVSQVIALNSNDTQRKAWALEKTLESGNFNMSNTPSTSAVYMDSGAAKKTAFVTTQPATSTATSSTSSTTSATASATSQPKEVLSSYMQRNYGIKASSTAKALPFTSEQMRDVLKAGGTSFVTGYGTSGASGASGASSTADLSGAGANGSGVPTSGVTTNATKPTTTAAAAVAVYQTTTTKANIAPSKTAVAPVARGVLPPTSVKPLPLPLPLPMPLPLPLPQSATLPLPLPLPLPVALPLAVAAGASASVGASASASAVGATATTSATTPASPLRIPPVPQTQERPPPHSPVRVPTTFGSSAIKTSPRGAVDIVSGSGTSGGSSGSDSGGGTSVVMSGSSAEKLVRDVNESSNRDSSTSGAMDVDGDVLSVDAGAPSGFASRAAVAATSSASAVGAASTTSSITSTSATTASDITSGTNATNGTNGTSAPAVALASSSQKPPQPWHAPTDVTLRPLVVRSMLLRNKDYKTHKDKEGWVASRQKGCEILEAMLYFESSSRKEYMENTGSIA